MSERNSRPKARAYHSASRWDRWHAETPRRYQGPESYCPPVAKTLKRSCCAARTDDFVVELFFPTSQKQNTCSPSAEARRWDAASTSTDQGRAESCLYARLKLSGKEPPPPLWVTSKGRSSLPPCTHAARRDAPTLRRATPLRARAHAGAQDNGQGAPHTGAARHAPRWHAPCGHRCAGANGQVSQDRSIF